MKKILLVLGMVTCMLGMTACGTAQEVDTYGLSEDQAILYADNLIESMNSIVLADQVEDYSYDSVSGAALTSFSEALEDMGEYQGVTDHEVVYDDGVTINVGIQGSKRDATVEIIFDEDLNVTSITTNLVYSFGELMKKAALNTLLGMGTVFAVLILISLLISCFSLLPKLQKKMAKKPETKSEPVDKAINQIIEKEEASEENDLELAAVIAAAVAAYVGSGSADGYVVRSIRRRNR
jgi:sodium pump decarboxylase gamma subunit